MGREASMKPNYEILAYLTLEKDRVLTGKPLVLHAKNEEELKEMTADIAKALKGDVVQLKNKDYMVIRV
jgi:siroheme synthase